MRTGTRCKLRRLAGTGGLGSAPAVDAVEMSSLAAANEFVELTQCATTNDQLRDALEAMCQSMGFDYFALTHHVDPHATEAQAIRLHNYPDPWVAWFDEHRLSVSDPVHRASRVTDAGFRWARVPSMIKLTTADREVLETARREGLGDGFTVPAHIPGEASGSCSFAVGPGKEVPEHYVPVAQLVGTYAFDAARRVNGIRCVDPGGPPLTGRQRDCVLWAARGKTNWETAKILGLSEETVTQHHKQARERLDIPNRVMLVLRALYDGYFCFDDVFHA